MADLIPVLLDTDIGSDIDDAVALAYLLRQPRCELLGITTVTGEVEERAACAEVICRAAGHTDIPIHCGAVRPLLIGPGQPHVPQYQAIRKRLHQTSWPANTAVEFLRQTIRKRPGQITLLTIGPFTNAALLFALDPEIPGMLKQLVSMGGCFFHNRREWNALVDPIATAMVYAARPPLHSSLGLDVTLQCQMTAEEVRNRFHSPPLDVVAEMAQVWFSQTEKLTFHDPLAAATIFHPELCDYVTGQVAVAIDDEAGLAGLTQFTETPAGPHRIARTVHAAAFFTELFTVLA
ncbi:MAG TPA: nucleoside hydrolase [Tepidisphaeraceae bacterium]|nr:nucleoside hydrolase [Tepidisphaeraceae bacterium]